MKINNTPLKFILPLVLIYFTFYVPGYSSDAKVTALPKNTFYSGLQVGTSYTKTKIRGAYDLAAGALFRTVESTESKVSKDIIGGFFVGAYHTRSQFIFGEEIEFDMLPQRMEKDVYFGAPYNWFFRYKISKHFSIIPSMKIGALLNDDTIVYGKLGCSISHYRIKAYAVQAPGYNSVFSKMNLGGVFGVGAMYIVNRNTAVRAEIAHIREKTFSKFDEFDETHAAQDDYLETKIGNHHTTFKIGLLYQFA
ncbi:MAG: outer membrane protein [Alphaproteobacteria bacterium]